MATPKGLVQELEKLVFVPSSIIDDHTTVLTLAQHKRILSALTEALQVVRPFAAALEEWGNEEAHQDDLSVWEHPIAMNVTLGDFRRAAAFIAQHEGEAK